MDKIIDFIILLAAAAVFIFIILEYAVGCGESYIDAEGQRHYYECLHKEL